MLFIVMAPSLDAQWRRGGIRARPGFGYRAGYWPGPVIGLGREEGKLKVEAPFKVAEVFFDGAFAGTAGELKTMRLRSGVYNIAVRAPGRARHEERVSVMAGKTLKRRWSRG
jgi:hypothetical protein